MQDAKYAQYAYKMFGIQLILSNKDELCTIFYLLFKLFAPKKNLYKHYRRSLTLLLWRKDPLGTRLGM